MSISVVKMLIRAPPFIETFLSGWYLKDLKPSLGKALWRKKILVHPEIWCTFACSIVLLAPPRRQMDEND